MEWEYNVTICVLIDCQKLDHDKKPNAWPRFCSVSDETWKEKELTGHKSLLEAPS